MEEYLKYIDAELIILIPSLYILGIGLKNTKLIPDKFIPLTLGAFGIFLSFLKLVASNPLSPELIFMAVTEGILCAGSAVYANQLIKQGSKTE